MYDPDAGHSLALRLGANKPRSAADEMADIERQMEALCARHAELALAIGSKVAQSEPISISDRVSGSFTVPASEAVLGAGQRCDGVVGIVTAVHSDGKSAFIEFRGNGSPIPASEAVLSADSDFWTHKHRTMTAIRTRGFVPVKDITGTHLVEVNLIEQVERPNTHLLRAAASGEIRDPAEALRHERP